jgi:CheY-like chemotaxis protein
MIAEKTPLWIAVRVDLRLPCEGKLSYTVSSISKRGKPVPQKDSTTILLVEDEALIALGEKAQLEGHGYTVSTTTSGEEAIGLADTGEFDLILMDIDLGPGKLDGTEAARRILQLQDIPIVFLTSHSEQEMVDRVEGISGYGYVLKNSGEFVLNQSIRMALKLHEAHQGMVDRENR